jgi:hypothetical protein
VVYSSRQANHGEKDVKPKPPPGPYLTTREAMRHLNIRSKDTLLRWARRLRPHVQRIKFGKTVRWPLGELERMVAEVTSTIR